MSTGPVYVGIDVSKATLDIHVLGGEAWQSPNTLRAMDALVKRIAALGPSLTILEATGHYELQVTAALHAAGLHVVVMNPRIVRSFARAIGRLAKTDRIDAEVLARYGASVQPEPRALPDAETRALEALVTRRAPAGGDDHRGAIAPGDGTCSHAQADSGAHRLAEAPAGGGRARHRPHGAPQPALAGHG